MAGDNARVGNARGGKTTRRGGVAILRAGFCAIGVNGSGQNYEDIYAFHSPSEHFWPETP